jgi:hypothetical protein
MKVKTQGKPMIKALSIFKNSNYFPLVLIFIIVFFIIILCLNFYLYDHFVSVTSPMVSKDMLFVTMHQLVHIFDKDELLKIALKIIIVGIVGLCSYMFLKNRKKRLSQYAL